MSRVCYSHKRPIFFTDLGVYIWNDNGQNHRRLLTEESFNFFSYDTIDDVEVSGSKTIISNQHEVELFSFVEASQLAEKIQALKELPQKQRLTTIKQLLTQETDISAIRAQQPQSSTLLFCLNLLSIALFCYLFIILPLHLYFQVPVNLSLLLYTALLFYGAIFGATHFYYKKYCGAEHRRLSLFLGLLLSPVTAMHITSILTKYKFSRFDYLGLAAVLLPEKIFSQLIKQELQIIAHSKEKNTSENFRESLTLKENCLMQLLAAVGISEQEIFAPPVQSDLSSASYCPLCEAEYQDGILTCPDCDVALKTY